MRAASSERGQALILIVFAIVGLVAITGLAVDGGMAYSDRRTAQNAADNAALAAALAHARNGDPVAVGMSSAATNGFDNNGTSNTVTVTTASSTRCPYGGSGEDINVRITSRVRTFFAPVIGFRQITNTVQAITRSCDSYIGPLFNGNAIIALGRSGIGFDAAGTPNWTVTGGGIFSNSSSNPSARCKGATDVNSPSLTTVGGVVMACSAQIPDTTTGAAPYTYDQYKDLLPPVPQCNGTARKQGPFWMPDPNPNANGSKVAFSGNMDFAAGLYCVTNSPGPFHGTITGVGVTFYIMPTNFSFKLSGGGTFNATAPGPGYPYAGILMFSLPPSCMDPLQNTQSIDLRGNGTAIAPSGSIITPCASITMFGNSNNRGYFTQLIGYNVDSGGNADIKINYDAGLGYQTAYPAWLTLLK